MKSSPGSFLLPSLQDILFVHVNIDIPVVSHIEKDFFVHVNIDIPLRGMGYLREQKN
jgi:hypothetical protein